MLENYNTPAEKNHSTPAYLSSSGVTLMPAMDKRSSIDLPSLSVHEKPGYRICAYVDDFITTDTGLVPRIKTRLNTKDLISTALVRCGINRYRYTVAPGLYAAGHPDRTSEVLVTANFKLTFDHLRKTLAGLNAWILVLDTKGINVWCAAGKGTFGTRELINRIQASHLDRLVDHRRVIVPQLGATGVCAGEVKKQSKFRVVYGPVRARDILDFLENGLAADQSMRTVSFTFLERIILIPVELQMTLKPALITAAVLLVLSGLGPGFFSFSEAWSRGVIAIAALVLGIISGAILTPALLPHIPVREFALKGIIMGCLAAGIMMGTIPETSASFGTGAALSLFCATISSFLAMNFTGTTPFTSPSGVEKEMKRYIPVQLTALVLATGFWLYSAF